MSLLLGLSAISACGNDWRRHDSPATFGVTGLWVFGPDDVWAASQNMLHYDGQSFVEVEAPTGGGFIADFLGFAPDDLFAVSGERLLHYDGVSWSVVDFGGQIEPSGLQAIWGTSKDDLWLGDSSNGRVFVYDGNQWRTTLTQTVEVEDLWGSSSTDIYAAGIFGVSHWDGSRWSNLEVDGSPGASGVFGFSQSDVWLVGDFAGVQHFNGTRWEHTSERFDDDFETSHTKLWGSAPNDVWAVGELGVISHFDGDDWTQLEVGDSPFLNQVHGSSTGNVWVTGLSFDGENTGLIYQRNP